MIKLNFLKFVIASLLVGSVDKIEPDESGWVSVERAEPFLEEFLEEENKIWVVFSKHFEGEKFQVRFPEDPSYDSEENELRLHAVQGASTFSLQVVKGEVDAARTLFRERLDEIKVSSTLLLLKAEESGDGKSLDLFYREGENWVWERILFSSKLIYTFHTKSSEMSGHFHRQFISSFDIL